MKSSYSGFPEGLPIMLEPSGPNFAPHPTIAEAFAYMRIIEHWGSGIPRFIKDCEAYQLPSPQLIDFDGDFRVNIFRKSPTSLNNHSTNQSNHSTNHSKLNLSEKEKELLSLIAKKPDITQSDISSILQWSSALVKYYMAKLKKEHYLERIGTNRKGHWQIVSDNED